MHVLMAAAAAAPASPWNPVTITTAIIASLSFLVAATGLVLGIVNYRHQTRRDFPKARWKLWWTKEEGHPGTIFHFQNEGRGEAQRVELWARPSHPELAAKTDDGIDAEGWVRTKEYGTMAHGDVHTMFYNWDRPIAVQIRYRHGANIHKVRVARSTGQP